MNNVKETIEFICQLFTLLAFVISAGKYFFERNIDKKRATIEAFNLIQEEVLDKLALVDRENAELMVNNLNNSKCKEAYNEYRVLLARLEHFAVAINERIYDIDTVDKLAGRHLIFLYKKVEPIIYHANKYSKDNENYREYCLLVEKLKIKHPELK